MHRRVVRWVIHCIKWDVPSVVKELTCFNLNSTKWPTFARSQHQAVHAGPPRHGASSNLPYICAGLPNYQHKFYAECGSSGSKPTSPAPRPPSTSQTRTGPPLVVLPPVDVPRTTRLTRLLQLDVVRFRRRPMCGVTHLNGKFYCETRVGGCIQTGLAPLES